MTIEMKLPPEPAQLIQLAKKAGLSDRELRAVTYHNYPQVRTVVLKKKMTFAEIAESDGFHLTRERVRVIHNTALKKLERFLREQADSSISGY